MDLGLLLALSLSIIIPTVGNWAINTHIDQRSKCEGDVALNAQAYQLVV